MKTFQAVLLLLIAFVVAAPLLAVDPPVNVQTSVVPVDAAKTARPPVMPTPMMAEIQAALEASRTAVAELSKRFQTATDPREAQALAGEIRRLKLENRVEVLRIQLCYARDEGRDAAVGELEDAITWMTTPRRTGQPIPRPSPLRPDHR